MKFDGDKTDVTALVKYAQGLEAEIARLQRIIDSRPAINAGLPETYITWTHSVYELEAARALGLTDR